MSRMSRELIHAVRIEVDLERCIGCGICVDVCPVSNFEVESKKAAVTDGAEERCFICRACEVSCPVTAILVHESLG